MRELGVLTLEEAVTEDDLCCPHRGIGGDRPGTHRREAWWRISSSSIRRRISDTATFTDPHRYPEGIDCVMVNGVIVVERRRDHREAAGTCHLRAGEAVISGGGCEGEDNHEGGEHTFSPPSLKYAVIEPVSDRSIPQFCQHSCYPASLSILLRSFQPMSRWRGRWKQHFQFDPLI